MSARVQIDHVHIVDRHRTDLGDIAGLAISMKEVGQLQPIVITPEHRLVAGERRIAAARSLGWTEIEAKVADNLADAGALLRAESDENTCRKAFTPSEAESIARAREEWLRPLAEAAKAHGQTAPGKPQDASAKFAEASAPAPDRQTRKIAAHGTGYSHETLRKVREVKDVAASSEQPEHVREVAREALTEMDRSGNVSGPHKRVKVAEQAAETQQVTDYLEADKAVQLASWRKHYMTAIVRMTEIIRFTPEQVAEKADEMLFAELDQGLADLSDYVKRVRALRPQGLRVVGGGAA